MPLIFSRIISRNVALKVILFVLIALLLFQYFRNRSLWLDEAMLSLNIIEKNYAALLHPLDYMQVAPILFLWIEKFFISVLGNSEPALRLFPLICAISSLPIFYLVCLELTKNKKVALVALFLMGFTPKFIYYSSEVKQYSVDLFVLLVIYYAALSGEAFFKKNRLIILSITGAIAIFLSNISVIPLFTVGLLLMYRYFRKKDWRILFPLIVWGMCFAINYFLFINNNPYTLYMKTYWHDSFLPVNPLSAEFRAWIPIKINQVFHDLLPSIGIGKLYILTIILYVASILQMLREKKFTLIYLCVAPVLLHLVLSALQLYPFELRLIIYQAPLDIIVLAYGIYHLSSVFQQKPVLKYSAICLFAGILSFRLFKEYPMNKEEIKPMIRDIGHYIQPGQPLYIYYSSIPSTLYYMKTGFGCFNNARIIFGIPRTNDYQNYLNEFVNEHGPTWLLFSHFYPFDGSRGEEQYILRGLSKRGLLMKSFQSFGSSAYLFNLK